VQKINEIKGLKIDLVGITNDHIDDIHALYQDQVICDFYGLLPHKTKIKLKW
jgi:hypothetical protein